MHHDYRSVLTLWRIFASKILCNVGKWDGVRTFDGIASGVNGVVAARVCGITYMIHHNLFIV